MKLGAKEAGAGLPPAIPPGLRAVSVRVNEVIGVAGYVLPGTRVDVVATVSPSGQTGDMTSKVILTNVQVLAAGTKIERDTDKNKPMPVSVVTLLVDPEEAERLTLASTEGKIQLALRNPLDKTMPATPASGRRRCSASACADPQRRRAARASHRSVSRSKPASSRPRRSNCRRSRSSAATNARTKSCVRSSDSMRKFVLHSPHRGRRAPRVAFADDAAAAGRGCSSAARPSSTSARRSRASR